MFTSNFASVHLLKSPSVPIAISRGHPRAKGGWKAHLPTGIEGRADARLAPSWKAIKGTVDDYHAAFAAQLAALDPARVYRELGEDAVLLCFCDISNGDCWCHRRIVAEWLESALGVMIPEMGERRDATYINGTAAYPFWVQPAQKLRWIEKQMEAAGLKPAGPYWQIETGWDSAGNCLICGEAGRCECPHPALDASPGPPPAPRRPGRRPAAHRQVWNGKAHAWEDAK